MAEKFHASTATQRAKDKVSKETARASWESHRDSGKPMSEWNDPSAEPMHNRYTRAKSEGILRSGKPMRSIKESLVNRGPGQRAAQAYVSGKPSPERAIAVRSEAVSSGSRRSTDVVQRPVAPRGFASSSEVANAPQKMRSGPKAFSKVERSRVAAVGERARYRLASDIAYKTTGGSLNYKADWLNPRRARITQANPVGRLAASRYLTKKAAGGGLLKTMAKAAGTVGRIGAKLTGPVGVALTAYDVYDTAKTVKETVGAARELGRVRAAGREAEAGTAAIKSAMTAKYPLAGSIYDKASSPKQGELLKVSKGQRKDRQSTISGIKVN